MPNLQRRPRDFSALRPNPIIKRHLTTFSNSESILNNEQKPTLKLNEVWAIRIRLQIANKARDLALFNLALDSKLRSCYLVKLKVSDVAHGTRIAKHSAVMQMKTKKPCTSSNNQASYKSSTRIRNVRP